MSNITYFQELEFITRKQKCVALGKQYEKINTTYDKNKFADLEINFIEFGKFCEHHKLDSEDLNVYDLYMSCDMKEWNINNVQYESLEENQLYVFFNRLRTGIYKAIITNEVTPILNDEEDILFWTSVSLNDLKYLEVGYDTIKIIKLDNSELFFEGLEEISDGEIILRQFLDNSLDHIIVKDSLTQIEIREDNIRNIDLNLLNKCKDIVNIRTVPEDSEYYLMNWDCLLVKFKDSEKEEIWQPC